MPGEIIRGIPAGIFRKIVEGARGTILNVFCKKPRRNVCRKP